MPPEQGALTSLQRLHGTRRTPGNDWACGGGNSGSGGGSSGRSVRPVRHRYGGGDSSNAQPAAGVLARVRYSVFTESSYDVVWNNYAWQQPMPWWVGITQACFTPLSHTHNIHICVFVLLFPPPFACLG